MSVKPVPEGYHTLTPNLVFQRGTAAAAIEYYRKAFDARVLVNMPGPRGEVMHAELQIGDSKIFVNDAMGQAPVSAAPGQSNPAYLHVYIPNVDEVFNRAVAAGARVEAPLMDAFWGDRFGKLADPFGQQWTMATHVEDVAPEEMKRRQEEFVARAAAGRS